MDRLRTTITPSLPSPPNPSSLLLHTLLLPLFLVLTIFGPGYQTISPFTVLYFPLSVYYIRNCTRWWWIFLFCLMNSIGATLAYLNTCNLEDIDEYYKNAKGVLFGVLLLTNLIMLTPYLFDKIAQSKFPTNGWARIMVFPCVWTGMWTISLFLSPFGDAGNYAFALLNNGEIIQLASFAGLGGINFILSWSGTVGCDIISNYISEYQDSASSNTGSIIIDHPTEDSTDTLLRVPPTCTRTKFLTLPKFINSLSIYLFVLFLVFSYGSIRLSTSFVPFYQKSISKIYPEDLISFGCVIVKTDGTFDHYANLTQNLAISGNKIILWSEALSEISNKEELNSLFEKIKSISITYNTSIGFTYIDTTTKKSLIKLVVINNKGDIVIDYVKSNLIPFVEGSYTKGDNKLQTFQSEEFGNVGAAICFDYEFPELIGQAPSKDVNLMLDASSTWGPLGPFHARMNSIRAIENGFTILRCSSYGISGVWDQYGQPLHYIPTVNTPTTTFQVPIPMIKNRVKTVYSVFGETFGWLCVGSIAIFLIALILAGRCNDIINYWF